MGNKIVGCALLLGLLIFLPEPGDGLAEFGETCRRNNDCKTAWCHNKKCECPSHNNGRHNVLVQFFDKARQKCVSAVGKACTMETHDSLAQLECVEHAVCRTPRRSSISTDIFGKCECRDEYKVTKDHLCALPHQVGNAEEQVGVDDTKDRYAKPKTENGATWTSISSSILTNRRNDYYFIIPFTLLIHYFCFS
jgi:hypothetical protein